jgi:hypothetical protein
MDELPTYHVYESYHYENYQANIHKLDKSMPFGLSLFPSLTEKNKINGEKDKFIKKSEDHL